MSGEAVDNVVAIRRVRDPFGYLGNMSPHPVSYHGAGGEFATAEALFQALRFPRDSSYSSKREEIRAARSPMAAKMIAKKAVARMHVVPRSAQDLPATLSGEDLENMRFVMSLKIVRHAEVKNGLLSTGDRHIVEDCTARQTESGLYWGAALRDREWFGLNTLGILWMEMRTRLRSAMQGDTGVPEQLRLEDV